MSASQHQELLLMMQHRQRALASLLSSSLPGSTTSNNGFLAAGWPAATSQLPFGAAANAGMMNLAGAGAIPAAAGFAAGVEPTSLPQLQLLRALAASQIANAAAAAPQTSLSSRGSKRSAAKDDSKPLRPRKRGRPSYKDRAAAALAAEEAAKAAKAAALAEREILLRQIAAQMTPQLSPQGAMMLLQQQLAMQQLGMFGANQIGGFPGAMCAAPPALAHMRAACMDAGRQGMPAAGAGLAVGAGKIADRAASGAASRQFFSSDVDFARLDSSALDQSRLFAVTADETLRQRTEDVDTHRNTDGHSGDENESDYNGDASSWPRRGKKQAKRAASPTHEASPKPLARAGGSSVTEDGTQAAVAAACAATNQAAPGGIFMAPPPSKSSPGHGGMPALDWMFSKDTRFVQPTPKNDMEEHADEHVPATPAVSAGVQQQQQQQQQQQPPAVVVAAAMEFLAQAMPRVGSRQVLPGAGADGGAQGMGPVAGLMGLTRSRSNIEAVLAFVDAEIQARKGRMGEAKEEAGLPAHLVPSPVVDVRKERKAQDALDLSLHL
ncbi:hypothetical protein CLOM_g15322 [Closterium sp. NIES-68]|nr:hypothetical protein CLOM_g24524 [Closterium sp. NIES-68]GJP56245.1 hypothetical protein CLOM_g15322 [Closterium sp. NIES-68]GJP61375.1 hypothetical protein CLOP_g18545 [Closterium sp. NIES-67]GJP62815.1 hypothetical protein CLOP_g19840 [Closterium sp. NIES-67]